MSTRSRIGIEGEDGTVTSVYCHSDGYPGHNGTQLLTNFNNAERAVFLMQHGDLSFIGGPDFAPQGSRGDNYDTIVAYRLWRNEENVDPRTDASRAAYRPASDWDIEYHYLYGPRGWEVDQHDGQGFVPLTSALCAGNE